MSKYDDFLSEPQFFSNDMYVAHGKLSAEFAAEQIRDIHGMSCEAEDLGRDRIRFGFPPETVEDRCGLDSPCWYSGASGHGSKEVWTYER